LTPAARLDLETSIDREEQLARAEDSLSRFEDRDIQAMAYIARKPLSIYGHLIRLPRRVGALISTIRRGMRRESLKYTEDATSYSIPAVLKSFWRASRARTALSNITVLSKPPADRFVFFGLHMQPESSVDVWAPFYSDQIWVIELLARSIPPAYKLLIKIHKSDVANYSRKQLDYIVSLPGVEIVEPFADTQQFIKKADLIVSIQGTIGLEGALYGKPVIMLGDSPNIVFDTVSRIRNIADLPTLVRDRLNTPEPARTEIVEAYTEYMAPFMPACSNDWNECKTDNEIDGFVKLFDKLRTYVSAEEKRNSSRSSEDSKTSGIATRATP